MRSSAPATSFIDATTPVLRVTGFSPVSTMSPRTGVDFQRIKTTAGSEARPPEQASCGSVANELQTVYRYDQGMYWNTREPVKTRSKNDNELF